MSARRPALLAKGSLRVVDLESVDRAWRTEPVSALLRRLSEKAPLARPIAGPVPGRPAAAELAGLDVAVESLSRRSLRGRPLAENLRALRGRGAPWRWFSRTPDERDETAVDDRLIRWAEVTRLPELTPDEILAVASAVEGTMIGASEVREAFERWGSDRFAGALESTSDEAAADALRRAWDDDLAPLLQALGFDEEGELMAAVGARLREVRELVRFARAHGLAVVPWTKDRWPRVLADRARARAAG